MVTDMSIENLQCRFKRSKRIKAFKFKLPFKIKVKHCVSISFSCDPSTIIFTGTSVREQSQGGHPFFVGNYRPNWMEPVRCSTSLECVPCDKNSSQPDQDGCFVHVENNGSDVREGDYSYSNMGEDHYRMSALPTSDLKCAIYVLVRL